MTRARPIKDVQAGDEVVATDPETGRTTTQVVERQHVNLDSDLVDVTLVGSDGVETLHTTQHHPFWSETRQKWVDAAELQAGERVHTLDGATVVALEVQLLDATRVMHDLTVSEIHTYYVVTGSTPVLVHNCGTATVRWSGEHAYIETSVDGVTLATDQTGNYNRRLIATHVRELRITDRERIGGYEFEADDVDTLHFSGDDLPNPAGAQAEQRRLLGAAGDYNQADNSCLTHCARVLRAGGHPSFQDFGPGSEARITTVLQKLIPRLRR